MSEAFVYCWTDNHTKKLYIGSHKGSQGDGYISSSRYLLTEYSIRPNDFSRKIIAEGQWTDMRILEAILIRKMWSDNVPCYNKNVGGMIRIDADVKKKMSEASLGKPKSEEHRKRIAIANKKKASDLEILKKLRQPKPQGHGAKVSAALTGRIKSEEHRKNISKSLTGRKIGRYSAEHRKAISDSLKGLPSKFKNMTYEEIMGKEKAIRLKELRSKKLKEIRAKLLPITCPYCNKTGSGPNMTRWHFDNCKHKEE